jgi:hypothetical protein
MVSISTEHAVEDVGMDQWHVQLAASRREDPPVRKKAVAFAG